MRMRECLHSVFRRGFEPGGNRDAHERPMIISVHVPKTAGTTFRFVLESLYRDRLKLDYGASARQTSGLIREALYAAPGNGSGEILREAHRQNRVGCIHGHFSAARYHEIFPEAEFIFWSRDPLERVISEFFHHRRILDPHNPLSRLVYEGYLNIWEFARQDRARNVLSRMLGGVPWERFSFAGVCERFEESLEAFACRFRARIDPGRIKTRNRNDTKPLLEDPALRRYILGLNRDDRRIHERVLRGYQAPAAAWVPPMERPASCGEA